MDLVLKTQLIHMVTNTPREKAMINVMEKVIPTTVETSMEGTQMAAKSDMTQGKNAAPVQSTLPAVAAEVGDVMDALEIGGGDGVGAGPASNANTSLYALHCNIHVAALHSRTCMNQCSLSLITGSTIYQIYESAQYKWSLCTKPKGQSTRDTQTPRQG